MTKFKRLEVEKTMTNKFFISNELLYDKKLTHSDFQVLCTFISVRDKEKGTIYIKHSTIAEKKRSISFCYFTINKTFKEKWFHQGTKSILFKFKKQVA